MSEQPRLECQDCGTTLRLLTEQEAQQVADDPYKFVVFCRVCAADQPDWRLQDER